MKFRHLLIACTIGLLSGCASEPPAPPVPASQWLGQWTIAGYTERGTATYKYDGRKIGITQSGAVFQLATPTGGFFFFPGMRFAPYGNQLVGRYVPDSDDLEDRFSDFPSAVLNQAAASRTCIYIGRLTMLQDGRIAVEHNNLQIFYSRDGRFSHCVSHDGWVRFTLSR
jgi:hypothetical protein